MTVDVFDFIMPVALSAAFLGLSWTSMRSINGGRPLRAVQRGMLIYGSLFVLGAGYLAFTGSALGLRLDGWVILFAAWGAFLTFVAWYRHRRWHAASGKPSNPAERRARLRQGFAVVALLVTLVIATIEWDFVWEHQDHWLAVSLWSAGVVGSILLAYGNRRTTVIVTLRAYLVLMVIGVIAEHQTAALIFLAIAAAVYLGLEKLWKKPQPPVLDLEALSREPSAGSDDSHAATKRH